MSGDVRAAAAAVITAVVDDGYSMTRQLQQAEQAFSDKRDRAMLKLLCFTTLRHYFWLDAAVEGLLNRAMKPEDGDVRALLLSGIAQLQVLEMPAYAAVSDSCDAAVALGKPWARGLTNAVLRNFLRQRDDIVARLSRDPVARYGHPEWLINRLKKDWPEHWEALLEAGNRAPPLWVRVNTARVDIETYCGRLAAQGLQGIALAGLPTALKIEPAVDVRELPGFADGLVSVQDAAAQHAASLLAPQPGQRVLDACAAPGGKTAHLLEYCAGIGELVALDSDAARLHRVAETLERIGSPHARLLAADARDVSDWWDGVPFERILLDAPCSATGVIRRHPDIKLLRRAEDIDANAAVQAELLDALWTVLAPGGRLLYATCSILPQENSQQISAFLARQPGARALPIDNLAAGARNGEGWQILSGDQDLDGFFYALLEKG